MDVQEDGGLAPDYRLKLNSYDLGVDVELADALQRIRFEHPEVPAVVIPSLKERVFCAGVNIFMPRRSSHANPATAPAVPAIGDVLCRISRRRGRTPAMAGRRSFQCGPDAGPRTPSIVDRLLTVRGHPAAGPRLARCPSLARLPVVRRRQPRRSRILLAVLRALRSRSRRARAVGADRELLASDVLVQVQQFNGSPLGLQFPAHVELVVAETEPGVKGDTASGGVTKVARLETGLEVRVPLFIKEGEKVKVATETRGFAGRA